MSFMHSVKIFFNNFSLCYKTLLYKIIALILSLAIVATFMYSPIKTLYNMGGLDAFINLFKVGSIGDFFAKSNEALTSFANTFNLLNSSNKTAIIMGIITFVLIFGFLYNLDKIPRTEIISNNMSSNMRLGYTGQFFRKIGYSALNSIVNLLYYLICCAIIILVYIGLLNILYINNQVAQIAPLIIFVVLCLLISFAFSVFGTHAASVILNDCGVFCGLFKAIKQNFKNFFKVFGLNLGFIVLAILINVFAAIISQGVLLVLTIPCTIVFYNVLATTICYIEHGNRYYIDKTTIITPKQNENFDKVKNIIDLI